MWSVSVLFNSNVLFYFISIILIIICIICELVNDIIIKWTKFVYRTCTWHLDHTLTQWMLRFLYAFWLCRLLFSFAILCYRLNVMAGIDWCFSG